MEAFAHAFNYLETIEWQDIIDIILVAYLIYKAIILIRKTSSHNLAKGLVLFLLILWLSDLFGLTMINYLLRRAVELGMVAVLILFQPELRRLLERLGSRLSAGKLDGSGTTQQAITQVVLACKEMSASKTGALIIFERDIRLNDIMSTGTIINADTTAELLKNIFYNKAPLHDGAVVIREGRIASAGCVLPLTKSTNLSKDLGMRHRAGIGLSEQSDAVVVVVSEETGSISVAMEGMLKRHLNASIFEKLLSSELSSHDSVDKKSSVLNILKSFLKVKENEEIKPDEKDT